MKFLVPIGGFSDERFGIMVTPSHYGIPAGIRAGLSWAGDNEAFTGKFDPDRFVRWTERMEPYRETCLFISVPDRVGDAIWTRILFEAWHNVFDGWPLAYVAQDGQENIEFPDPSLWSTLFIGGSTHWKMSSMAIECIKRAQVFGKHIHVGRVNFKKRYMFFRQLQGSEDFTCDGTRTTFERDNAIKAWIEYMALPAPGMEAWQICMPISDGNCRR